MEEYRALQRQKHEQWKKAQEEEEMRKREEKRKEELRQEQKKKDDFIHSELDMWSKEGYEFEDCRCIAEMQYNTYLILKYQDVKFIHARESVPRLFGICAFIHETYYFFDVRLLMDFNQLNCQTLPQITQITQTTPIPRLFNTGIVLDETSYIIIQEYWNVVNPYRSIMYKSRPFMLHLKTREKSPVTDQDVQTYVASLCEKDDFQYVSPFEKDKTTGAFSVTLPESIMTPLLTFVSFDDQKTNQQPLAVELCIPGYSLRVYAYCRNPDEVSDPGTVIVPWRLKYMMKAFEDQEVYVRIISPPLIPVGKNLPALRLVSITKLPDHVDEVELRTSLHSTLNHMRVVFPSQVILLHVNNVYGPIPFMVSQVYTKNGQNGRIPCAVTSVFGHGSGVDCVVETTHAEEKDEKPGFEKYFIYLCNLKRKTMSDDFIQQIKPLDDQMVADSIRDQLLT
jgi:hypothetical protein